MKIVHRVQVKRKQIQTEIRQKNTDTHIKRRIRNKSKRRSVVHEVQTASD